MRKLLLYILSSPLFVIGLLFDLIKFPVVVVIFLPFSIFMWVLDLLRGGVILTPFEFCCDVATMGIQMWWEVVNG